MLKIKSVYKKDNKLIYIVSGQYEGDYGISNHWTWREVNRDGTLGDLSCGYGGDWPEVDAQIEIKVKIKEK